MASTGGYDAASGSGSANGFIINVPDMSGGTALGVNLDLGLSPGAMAQQAYDYLNNSFTIDRGFVNQSISGTQGFLSNQIAPVLAGAANQIQQNAKYIPDLYNGLNGMGTAAIGAIQQNTAAGIAAQQAETTASINASSNSGGGCFITTAVCDSLNLPDDNLILATLRKFRDAHMIGTRALRTYYAAAPFIVAKINRRADARRCYRILLRRYIIPACRMIDAGLNDAALRFYSAGCDRAALMACGE